MWYQGTLARPLSVEGQPGEADRRAGRREAAAPEVRPVEEGLAVALQVVALPAAERARRKCLRWLRLHP